MPANIPRMDTAIRRWLPALLLLFGIHALSYAQDGGQQVPGSAQDPVPGNAGLGQVLLAETPELPAPGESLSERVDQLIQEILLLEKIASDADELFLEVDRTLQTRVNHINQRMKGARSPLEPVYAASELPGGNITIQDLHNDVEELYAARIRLLEYVTPNLHLEVTAADVIGVDQLALELQFIWEQVRFRGLNLPAASRDLWRRIQIAPLPVIWQIIKFIFVIALFRWWREWFPETLRRMRTSLAEIRPRSAGIMRRIRTIWYVGQIRRPLEWLLLFHIIFSMVDMPGLNFLSNIIAVVVRWILLGWFSVSLLNAVAARGDAGLTGTDASVRRRSLRLVATWLVLLGLGLSLAENLAGVATVHAWVWHLFQLMSVPVLVVLLAWWRKPIFARLEREGDNTEAVEHMLKHRSGLRSYRNAASGAIWLMANGLRRRVMRVFLQVGADQGLSFGSKPVDAAVDSATDAPAMISDEVREILLQGVDKYERYGRAERRRLTHRISSKQGGIVAVVGERGIGKRSFLQTLSDPLDGKLIVLDCSKGQFSDVEASLSVALNIQDVSAENISAALRECGTRVIAVDKLHRLVRPVIGGQNELSKLNKLVQDVVADVLWVFAVDCFAWQFLRRVRADQSSINEIIQLPSWTEEQLGELIDLRNSAASLEPDFAGVQIPDEHVVTSLETAEARNRASVYRMIWTLSGGNPTVALRIWSNTVFPDDSGQIRVRTPAQPATRDLDDARQNVLLVLRAIAQSEVITADDVVDNLRLPAGAVGSAMHYCESRGWIEENDGYFSLSMQWFRTITRTLARQNLLAR
ncbi:MAG: hypothetical protein ACI88G_001008 [Woeseiaceae bacterium]